MQKRRGLCSRLFAIIMSVTMATILMLTFLGLNAGAVNDDMEVSSFSVVNNSPLLSTIAAGQVWTGKRVSETGIFGDGKNGQFNVTLSAIGGATNDGTALIDAAGLTFNDTFKSEFEFVPANTEMTVPPNREMTFYLNGTAHTIALTGGIFSYSEGSGPSLVTVSFDPANNTVEYFIGQSALKTIAAGAVPSDASYNTLTFGVRLTDAVNTAGTYNTNETSSCTARYNTIQSTTENRSSVNTATYTNTQGVYEWVKIDQVVNKTRFTPWYIHKLDRIRIFYDDFVNYTKFYAFTGSEIGYSDWTPPVDDPSTVGVNESKYWTWDVWIVAGEYDKDNGSGGTDHIKVESNANDGKYHITVHTDASLTINPTSFIIINDQPESEFYRYTIGTSNIQFVVDQMPTAAGGEAKVTVGSTQYTGNIGTYDPAYPNSWSFTSGSNQITLVDGNTLTVTTSSIQTFRSTSTVPVTQPHDDYGIVTLAGVLGTSDKEPEPSPTVAGETEKLPQTDGFSISTMIGLIGFALIATGSGMYIIVSRSKRHV